MGGKGIVLVSQNRAVCTRSLGEEFKGLLRCAARGWERRAANGDQLEKM